MSANVIQLFTYVDGAGKVLAVMPAYWCPVCAQPHPINVDSSYRSVKWSWNGSHDKPTFTPSILFYSHASKSGGRESDVFLLKRDGVKRRERFKTREEAQTQVAMLEARGDSGWAIVERKESTTPGARVVHCHVHVRDGNIQVLPDTPGSLGGKTLPLVKWDKDLWMAGEGDWERRR